MKDEKNNKYFGYCIDLFDKLASICNFTYEISLIKKDENNSIKINKTNEENWNRIVNELIQKKADLSTPLTITSQREKLIDFTKPLMSLGISVLSKREKLKGIDLFAFFSPFCWETWISLIGIYLGYKFYYFQDTCK